MLVKDLLTDAILGLKTSKNKEFQFKEDMLHKLKAKFVADRLLQVQIELEKYVQVM